MSGHYNTPTPKCPHCGHEMDTDEMCYGTPTCDVDLFALAPNEDRAVIHCPKCGAVATVRHIGGKLDSQVAAAMESNYEGPFA